MLASYVQQRKKSFDSLPNDEKLDALYSWLEQHEETTQSALSYKSTQYFDLEKQVTTAKILGIIGLYAFAIAILAHTKVNPLVDRVDKIEKRSKRMRSNG